MTYLRQTEPALTGQDSLSPNGNGHARTTTMTPAGIEAEAQVLRLHEPELEVAVQTSVVIPALNEVETIGDVVERVLRVLGPHDEVVVVDDGSTDGTGPAAEAAGARVVTKPYAGGNGSAIKAGVRHARGRNIIFMDADGQHDPADIPMLLDKLSDYDMVVGARSADSHAGLARRIANTLVFNKLAAALSGRPILDLPSGFRAMRRRVPDEFLSLLPNTFGYPATITLATVKAGYSLHYVPITAAERQGSEPSRIKPMRDGIRFLSIILKIITMFAPMRVFGPLSIVPVGAGLVSFAARIFTGRGASVTGALLLMTGLFLFCIGLVSEQIAALRFERHGRHGIS